MTTFSDDAAEMVKLQGDSEYARQLAIEALQNGRLEFGVRLAQVALEAARAARAAQRTLPPLVPEISEREACRSTVHDSCSWCRENPEDRMADVPPAPVVPGHRMDQAGGWHGPGACVLGTPGHQNAQICGPAADDQRAAEPAEPPTSVVTTARCNVDVQKLGSPGLEKCWGAIYYKRETGMWHHVQPDMDVHHTPIPYERLN